jgi:hypothetical protein
MLFDHCATDQEAWHTFHEVACLCHPAQGGQAEDMHALCAMARERLGGAWQWGDDTPNMFDIYCRAHGKANPFGHSISAGTGAATDLPLPGLPPGYDPAPPHASLPRTGRIWLLLSSRT